MSIYQVQSKPTEKQSVPEEQGFDYTILSPEIQMIVQQNANEIKRLMRRTAQDIINIGQKLLEVKEQLGHGHFEGWLKVEFNWGMWTARKFMQVARQFQSISFTDLSIDASALYLLAAPSTSQEVRQEALKYARQGESITYARVKAIANRHNELAKSQAPNLSTFDISTKAYSVTQTVNAQSAVVLEKSEDKRLRRETAIGINKNNCYLEEQVEIIDMRSLFKVKRLVCIVDFVKKNHKLVGEIVEIKEATSKDIEVLIKIPFQSLEIEE